MVQWRAESWLTFVPWPPGPPAASPAMYATAFDVFYVPPFAFLSSIPFPRVLLQGAECISQAVLNARPAFPLENRFQHPVRMRTCPVRRVDADTFSK